MPLGIMGRFYASIPVLYLTGRFYVDNLNFGAYSKLVFNNGMCAHKGKIYANLILEH